MPIPRQLPAPPAHFVGRDVELAEIDRLLTEERTGPALIVINGVGGIGKSAIALQWAQRVNSQFPDGQLYAHLGAFNPTGPIAPAEVLGQMLRSLGVAPQRVPADTAERAATFRSITAGRKLLLLWDDAVSAAQVRPLLPTSSSCVVVVTTRWRLAGLVTDGARFLAVEPLSEPVAIELLTRAVGADRTASDPASTSSLVRLCAGFPIALAVTGARLATRPRWPIRRLVNELAEEHRRLRGLGGQEDVSLQSAFDLSYQELPDPVARCYRMVGLHPGTEFGLNVVAAGLEVGQQEAADLLDALLEASLLSETADNRYRLHDLVRLHARQHAETDPDQPLLTRRIIEWYLAGVSAADRLLTPYRRRDRDNPFATSQAQVVALADRDEALAWLEQERGNLVAAIQYAASHDLLLLAWQIADAMWPLFHYHRHHRDRMEVDRLAVRCAQQLNDHDREARMLRRWAFAHFDLAQFDRARELFERCLQLCEEIGDQYGTTSAVEGLGLVALVQRRHPQAVVYFSRQLRLCREAGQHRRIGLALLNLAMVGNESAQHRLALFHLRDAAAIFASLGDVDPYNDARVRIELGRALGHLGEHRPAREKLTQALADMRYLDSPRGQAQALHRLGELALAGQEFAEARTYLTQALRLYEEIEDVEAGQVRHLTTLIPPADTDPHRMP
ncbi:tetratricopeptide repeat protein [Micromonospora sp. WMMD1082]|uniref:tetratricopeptide repeat protein n=1 Tax=Micromonospora sp. WMMD1082 TaxID=3016104 RepID=UPI002416877C|nr:tetratricopeptide repeat protein [Micromonospora sp. WMMD1082]MDG4796291.1 tetratricopeptide repeat protein [Micromonospora sp. WMMD1082]